MLVYQGYLPIHMRVEQLLDGCLIRQSGCLHARHGFLHVFNTGCQNDDDLVRFFF